MHGVITSHQSKFHFLRPKVPDNYCCIFPFILIETVGFSESDEQYILGRRLLNQRDFFVGSFPSIEGHGILLVDKTPNTNTELFELKQMIFKFVCLPYGDDNLLIPLLHECTW